VIADLALEMGREAERCAEGSGVPLEVRVGIDTGPVYERLRDAYELSRRGTIEVKGKGPMTTYLLLGHRARSGASA
jgi:class 3 adenylate cyclase